MRVLYLLNWNFKMLVFVEGGKPENLKRDVDQQQIHVWHQAGIAPDCGVYTGPSQL